MSSSNLQTNSTPPRRRWFQYSLRTSLLVDTNVINACVARLQQALPNADIRH